MVILRSLGKDQLIFTLIFIPHTPVMTICALFIENEDKALWDVGKVGNLVPGEEEGPSDTILPGPWELPSLLCLSRHLPLLIWTTSLRAVFSWSLLTGPAFAPLPLFESLIGSLGSL